MTIQSDIQKLEPGVLVDLFILDCTMLEDKNGDPGVVFRFCSGLQENAQPIVFQGETYEPFPIIASGFEYSGVGKATHPKVVVSNVTGIMFSLNLQFRDLVGAKVTRKRTFARYLDGYPDEDPTAEFPEEIYFIERKVTENRFYVEYELSGIYDFEGFVLPASQVIADFCCWEYRGAECSYTGEWCFTVDDLPLGNSGVLHLDVCGKRLSSCQARFPGRDAVLPFGGFPTVGKIK